MLFLLLLFFLPITNIIAHQDYPTIPLSYETAINRLKQYQQTNFVDLLNDSPRYSITSDRISSYISSVSDNQTTQCERDFDIVVQALTRRETWALKVIDAWGKPIPSGILKGNTYWVGNYDECLQPLYLPTNKTFVAQPFETQYCTLTIPPSFGLSITLGLCVPSSCDRQGVVSLIHSLLSSNISANSLICSNDPPNGQKALTTGAIITIIILSLLGFLVFLGTIIDLILMLKADTVGDETTHINGYDNNENTEYTSLNKSRNSNQLLIDTTPRKIFLTEFSAVKNLRRIFTTEQKNDKETYAFINGVRVLSLFWVIIGHSFLFGINYSSNPLDLIEWTRSVAIQFISSAEFSVDTFFVLSGFLTTILFVQQVEKEKQLSPRLMFLYYIHRYIRLTPTYLVVIAISIHLTPYFGSGPVYPTQGGLEASQCRSQYWWTSIVYMGNIVKSDYLCLPVSWYLQNDMQFHWIAPLCLIPFVLKRKPVAFVVCISLILVGIGSIAGLLIYYPDLQASNNILAPPTNGRTFFNTIYVTPWCRISAYFIGVLAGFSLINTGRSYRMNRYVFGCGNFLCILFVLICIFALYPDQILVPGVAATPFVIYQSFSRTLWSLAMGWIFFLCMINRGGIVNKILSWSIWAPLGRLNYATYLTHLTIIFISNFNQRLPFYYQLHLVFNNFVAHIFFSYIAAIIVVLFIETPFFILEKKLFKR